MAEEQAWPEVPGLDDWYDNAIKAGQGFKSDKEREDYIKSIGDPMMHPLFAENTEDLEGNPLAEALRALREEDKTPIEIATMYKDEGNDWLRKGDKKSLNDAYDRYSHALNILDGTASAAASGASSFNADTGLVESSADKCTVPSLYPLELLSPHQQQLTQSIEEERVRLEEERMLKSQILSNRAMVSLTLKNYGSCVADSDLSLSFWPGNIKAHYRKCRALVALRKFEDGLLSCDKGLNVEPSNTQIAALKDKCSEELAKLKTQLRKVAEMRREVEQHWTEAWRIISGAARSSDPSKGGSTPPAIAVGYASASQQPAQLEEALPHIVSGAATDDCIVGWPVVMLYPQYSQIDVIQGVDAGDMLAVHLAEMFPELADLDQGGCLAVLWDRDREYQVSQLAVYAPLEAAPRIHTLSEWLESCREQSAMRGELGSESCEAALKAAKTRSTAHEMKLSTFDSKKLESASKKNPSQSSSSSGSSRGDGVEFGRVGYLDVHLGCTFQDILTSPGHVLAGGLLTLLIFVRGNEAHTKFLRDAASVGRGVWPLSPSGQ